MAVVETLAPTPRQQFFNNNGVPLVNGLLFTYATGTQIKTATFTDSTGNYANSNPIVLDSRGECDLWIPPGTSYTFTLSPPGDTDPPSNPIWTRNGIQNAAPTAATQASIGALLWPQTALEIAANITPSNYGYQPGWIPRYGAVDDPTNTYGGNGTDNTAAIAAALSIAGQPVYVPPGLWGFKNIIVPAGQTFFGAGVNVSNLIALSGATGTMCTDNNDAAKTIVQGLSFYCNGPSTGNCTNYTAGFQMGKTAPFGTEGYIGEIQVRDLPSGTPGFAGFDVTGNVGEFGNLYLLSTGGLQILGTANMVKQVENVDAQGFQILGTTIVGANLGDCNIEAMEVEAPGNYTTGGSAPGDTPVNNFTAGIIPFYFSGNVSINALWLSLSDSNNPIYESMILIGPSCTTWNVNNLKLYYQPLKLAAINGGIFEDSSGNFFPGNSASASGVGSHAGEGSFWSGLFNAGPVSTVKQQQIQSFTLRVANLATVINHLIGAAGSPTTASNFVTQISGALNTYTPTPTGPDASTPFAAGGKIGSVESNTFYLNTAGQTVGDALLHANITSNTTSTAYQIIAAFQSADIAGAIATRLSFSLINPATGVAVSWATALSGASTYIDVTFLGYVR